MALGTGLSFQYWDTTANKTKRIAVGDSVTSNVGRFYQAQVRQLYTGGNGALNLKSSTDDDLAVFNDDGTVSIGVSGQNTTVGGNLVVTGDLTVNGTTTIVNSTEVDIADNIIFVNSGPSGSKNAGYASERYQVANNAGTGDVVNNSTANVAALSDIGDQTGMSNVQITLTGGSSTNDYYIGMWVKTAFADGANVRKITAYNGTTKVATVATAWDTQPSSNSAVNIYSPYTGLMFDSSNNRWVSALLAGSSANNAIIDALPFQVGALYADDGITVGSGQKIASVGGTLIVSGGFGGGTLSLRSNGGSSADGLDITQSSGILAYKSLIPNTDSSYSLGSSSAAWSNVYADTVTTLTANGYIQIGSSTVALRLPNLDDTAVGNLAAVAAGGLIWNTTDTEVQVYNGSAWVAVGGAGDTSGLTGTTNLTYTINSDGGASADEDAALVLISDDGSNKDTGTLTYVAGTLGGSNRADYGVWSFAAHVGLADSKELRLGAGNDLVLKHDGTDSYITNTTGALVIANSDVDDAIILKLGTADADTSVAFKDSANGMLFRVQGDGSIQTYSGTFDVDATGAVAIDTTAGISLDAASASNFTVTGGDDLTLETVGGGDVVIASSMDLTINSTTLTATIGGSFSLEGADASNFSVTGADLTLSTITSGTLAVTSAGALNLSSTTGDWQASGAVTIDSSGGSISIGGDADAQAINIGTGGAARTITFGNTTGATALVFNAGTGLLDFNATMKLAFGSDFCFDGFTIDGGLASGEFAYISANNTLAEATAASGGHCDLIEGIYNGTGLVTAGPVSVKKPSGEVWAAGDRVFVNNAASGGTTTAPSASGTDVREIGRVINAAGNGTSTARILLDLSKDTISNP